MTHRKAPYSLLLLLLVFLPALLPAQTTSEEYLELIKKGDSLYRAKEYKNAALVFSNAFKGNDLKIRWTDRYNAASCWALAGNKDSAFANLYLIATASHYSHYGSLISDPDMMSLHSDNRWMPLVEMVSDNRFKEEPNLNRQLVLQLDTVYSEDQRYRMQLAKIEETFGWNSKEMQDIWKVIREKDSLNLMVVKAILDKHGWQGAEVLGKDGASALFLVIQHADLPTQEKYLPVMREAVRQGKAQASSLALLEDRVALRQGKKQIYGSQLSSDPVTHLYYLSPLEDPDNVDKRRATVGLKPLSLYLKQWQVTWDVEQYKKDLPAIMEKEKAKGKW